MFYSEGPEELEEMDGGKEKVIFEENLIEVLKYLIRAMTQNTKLELR